MLYEYVIVTMNTFTGIYNLESIVKRKRRSEFLVIVERTVLEHWFEGAGSSLTKFYIFGEMDGGWFFSTLLFEKEERERVKCIDCGLSVAATRTWQCDGRRPTSWWRWWSAWGLARSWVGSRMSLTVSCPLPHSSSWMDHQRPGTVELLELSNVEPNWK